MTTTAKLKDHDLIVRDDAMLTKHNEYKHETPYTGPFLIMRCWTNGIVSFKTGATGIMYNIRRIKPYKLDTKVEDSINMYDDVNILLPIIYFCLNI